MTKRIPDCPGGMGNANDWIKAREALGYPQNRTVSYEYTTYENNNSDTVDKLCETYEKIAEIRYGEGYNKGYVDGYEDALEDIKDAIKTDLSGKSIRAALEAEPIDGVSVSKRYKLIQPITDTVKRMTNASKSSSTKVPYRDRLYNFTVKRKDS